MSSAAKFPIVGIGASAGGLAAVESFFSAMPAGIDPGMAFVLVQHLAPDHKSILAELVKRFTAMDVCEARDGMVVAPNHAYIIPPNFDLALLQGVLHLIEPLAPRGHRLPIDFFFRSLAQDQRDRAICVVLSGTGSDGTLGLRAVKGAGGMAMAQDPATTAFDGMPRSAIATGLVDFVLPPAEMGGQLIAYARQAFAGKPPFAATVSPRLDEIHAKLLRLVRARSGHDFSGYKHDAIQRRIQRRMALHHIDAPADYLQYLQNTPPEVHALFRDFLVGTTHFFRDPDAFDAIASSAIPSICKDRNPDSAVRVWVPACSTGEEAYSIAILLEEYAERAQKRFLFQIFASDIDGHAIEHARAGIYPASINADVSAARLARHFSFDPATSSYRVNPSIREMLIFSEQDITRDPPFSRLDLISCRNLMIYLGADLQRKLMFLFHYALRPNGFLALGNSESIGACPELFSSVDPQSKLYQRLPGHEPRRQPKSERPPPDGDEAPWRSIPSAHRPQRAALQDLVESALLHRYAPSAALVTSGGEILYIHGRTGPFLEPVPGKAAMNILAMAREGLRHDLTQALRTAATRREPVRVSAVRVQTDGDFLLVDLEVQPVAAGAEDYPATDRYLVTFQPSPPALLTSPASPPDPSSDSGQHISSLREALHAKEKYLQAAMETMDSTNEQLRSSHEEMQSINEELRSANEELETSKEELQSVNEELTTVNLELQERVSELSRANSDMNNLLAGTGVGTIFVDHQLRLRRFTPAVTQVINLIQSDIGRPVGDIVSNLIGHPTLTDDIQAVLDSLTPREIEVETRTHFFYLIRILPYRTQGHVIEGAVILFFDITELVRIRESRRLGESTVQQMAATLPQLLWTFTPDGVCDYISPQWTDFTGVPEPQLLGRGWLKQLHPADRDRTVAAWNSSIGSALPLNLEFRIRARDGRYRWFRSRIAPVPDPATGLLRWFGANSDIDAEKQAAFTRRVLLDANPVGILLHNADGLVVDANAAARHLLGLRLDQIAGRKLPAVCPSAIAPGGAPVDWETAPTNAARLTGRQSPAVPIALPVSPSPAWLRISALPLAPSDQVPPVPVCTVLEAIDEPDTVTEGTS